MAPYLFQTVAKTGKAEVVEPHLVAGKELWMKRRISRADINGAREWYREKAEKIKAVNVNRLMKDSPERLFTKLTGADVGSMVSFFYDPKHKAKMPYWDTFPLVFPLEDQGTHFLGLNLHYLPPVARSVLMNALYDIAVKNDKHEVVKLHLSYGLLKKTSRYKLFQPCLKQYIKGHLRSRFFYIPPSEWDFSLLLPTQRFSGATAGLVWRDSINKVYK